MADEVDFFFVLLYMKVFLKLIVSLCVCVFRHAQNTENGKFTICLEHVKKNGKDEVIFLPADKRQRFPQTDTIILKGYLRY